MPKPKRTVIVLWEPLAMLAIGALILAVAQPAAPAVRLIAGIVTGLLFISAGVTLVVWLTNYRAE